MEVLNNLINWYASNCNGDWEHTYGVKIDTLDNPGWTLQIDLLETSLSEKSFSVIQIERNESDWIFCTVENGIFKGSGGLYNLEELISIFLSWVGK